jgi:phospholipase/carboxylesterase
MKYLHSPLLLLLLLASEFCISQSKLVCEVRDPRSDKSKPAPAVILLHGWGSDEKDLLDLSDALPRGWVLLTVRAPFARPAGGYMWYGLQFGNGIFREDVQQANASTLQLRAFVREKAKSLRLDTTQLFIGGFSQGAIMALRVGLQSPYPVRGIICLSGRFPPDVYLGKMAPVQKARIPVFVAHGTGAKKVGTDCAGGCYAAQGPTAIQWHGTRKSGAANDAAALVQFAKSLAPGSLLRHHIAGDIGQACP